MSEPLRKITINVPEDLLSRAIKQTGKGITATVVEGLHELERREKRSALRYLKGRVEIDVDLERTRQ
ncbi:MAG: hypothetical protein R3C68_07925 [Myxococcota bacterium]